MKKSATGPQYNYTNKEVIQNGSKIRRPCIPIVPYGIIYQSRIAVFDVMIYIAVHLKNKQYAIDFLISSV